LILFRILFSEVFGVTGKPGSVEDSHLSCSGVAAGIFATYLFRAGLAAGEAGSFIRNCLVLLRMGFAMPLVLPPGR